MSLLYAAGNYLKRKVFYKMQTLIIYDIEEDKIRNKTAEFCKDYGLKRIQYSAFQGDMNRNRREELYLKLRKLLGENKGNIQIFPICEKDLAMRKKVENE